MLVLSSKENDAIIIRHNGKEIGRIIVTELYGKKVRLGFSGLDGYEINRSAVDRLRHPEAK